MISVWLWIFWKIDINKLSWVVPSSVVWVDVELSWDWVRLRLSWSWNWVETELDWTLQLKYLKSSIEVFEVDSDCPEILVFVKSGLFQKWSCFASKCSHTLIFFQAFRFQFWTSDFILQFSVIFPDYTCLGIYLFKESSWSWAVPSSADVYLVYLSFNRN